MSWNPKEPRFQNVSPSAPPPRKFTINGEDYARIPYGKGPDDLDHPTCDDCGVPRGSLPKLGCDLEPCPRCDAQAITCDCFYEDD